MCSSMLFVVQSTIVTPSIVRGSAPRPTTISLVRARSCARAGEDAPAVSATRATTSRQRRSRKAFSLWMRGRAPIINVNGKRGKGVTRRPGSNPKLRIEPVAQPIAEEIHAERRERQRGAGEGGEPPRHVEE